eukprot:IDg4826t1
MMACSPCQVARHAPRVGTNLAPTVLMHCAVKRTARVQELARVCSLESHNFALREITSAYTVYGAHLHPPITQQLILSCKENCSTVVRVRCCYRLCECSTPLVHVFSHKPNIMRDIAHVSCMIDVRVAPTSMTTTGKPHDASMHS